MFLQLWKLLGLLFLVLFLYSKNASSLTTFSPGSYVVKLNFTDAIQSVPLIPPYRIYYRVEQLNATASAALLIFVFDANTYARWLKGESDLVGISGLAPAQQTTFFEIKSNYIDTSTCQLVVQISPVFTASNVTAFVSFEYDYTLIFWNMPVWGFGLVAAVVGAVLISLFIIMLYFIIARFALGKR